MNKTLSSEKNRKTIINFIILIILLVYSVLTIIPFYFLFVRSFIPITQATEFRLWPGKPEGLNMNQTIGNMSTYFSIDLEKFKKKMGVDDYVSPSLSMKNFAEKYNISEEKIHSYMDPLVKYNGWLTMLTSGRFINSMLMTTLITLTSIILGGLLGISTGSVLARFKRRWHMTIYNLYMAQIIIPAVMIMLPLYIIMVRYLGLGNSYLSLLLLNIKGGAVSTMLFTAFISSIPNEIYESVEVDGGNRIQYFFLILIPLCKVPLATFAAISLPGFWNDLLNGILFLKPEKYTLVPLINSLQGTYASNYQAIYAGLAITLIPIIIIYFSFQNLFVKSALSGALKG